MAIKILKDFITSEYALDLWDALPSYDSDDELIDGSPETQGFGCSSTDFKGRLISLCDIVSQIAKLVFETIAVSLMLPITALFTVGRLIQFGILSCLKTSDKKQEVLKKALEAANQIKEFSWMLFAHPVARIIALSGDIAGIAFPICGQRARQLTATHSLIYNFWRN